MLARFAKSLFLAFVLLFAQQAGWVHAASHLASDRAPAEKQLPHSPACEQCVAHAPLGAGLVSQPPILGVAAAVPVPAACVASVFVPRPYTPCRSRAPPVFPAEIA